MRVHLALLAVQLTFGIFPVVARLLMQQMSPFALASLRVLGSTLVFQALLWWRFSSGKGPGVRLVRRDYYLLMLGGVLGIALNQLSYIYGLALTGAMNATWISGSIPVFTLLMATFRKMERPTAVNWLGVFLAFAGCLWLVGLPGPAARDNFFLGSLFLVAGCVLYSAYLVLLRPILQRLPTLDVVAWTFTFGTPIILLAGWKELRDLGNITAAGWWGLLLVIDLPTVAAYLLNNWALGRARPSLVASYINVQPILVGSMAVFLLDEQLSAQLLLSGTLIFSGVFFASRRAHLVPASLE